MCGPNSCSGHSGGCMGSCLWNLLIIKKKNSLNSLSHLSVCLLLPFIPVWLVLPTDLLNEPGGENMKSSLDSFADIILHHQRYMQTHIKSCD